MYIVCSNFEHCSSINLDFFIIFKIMKGDGFEVIIFWIILYHRQLLNTQAEGRLHASIHLDVLLQD